MSVTFHSSAAADVLSVPVNVSNANAFLLLEALGYEPGYAGTLDPDDLLGRIERVRRAIAAGQGREFTRQTVVEHGLGVRCISFGADEGYILHRLSCLKALATAALCKGASVHFA